MKDSLREIKTNQAITEQIMRRLLSMRILSHEVDKQIAAELVTLSPTSMGERTSPPALKNGLSTTHV